MKLFHLTMACNTDAPQHLATSTITDLDLAEVATTTARALEIIRFRGSVTFIATGPEGDIWSAVVTFTDDLAEGMWLNTRFK